MFYIVRELEDGVFTEYTYDKQEAAEAHMQQTTNHAELYVWLAGREEYMYSVN
jgi:hypothetical protein